jgi:hypothetical protein
MGDEQRKRGVSPSPEGLRLVQKAMNQRCWDAADVASAVSQAEQLNCTMDKKTVERFLGKDPNNQKVDKKKAQAICYVLALSYEAIILFKKEFGQLETDTENPFTFGPRVSADRFYGRQRTIADLKGRIGARSPQCVNLVGLRRSGKTSMLRYVKERPQEFFGAGQNPLIVYLDLQDGRYHSPIGLLAGLRHEIATATREEPWLQAEDGDAFAVEDGLRRVRDRGFRLIVMLDELERIGVRLGEFQDWGEDWRAKASAGLFSLVMATKRPLGDVYESLGLTSPFDNIFSKTMLGALGGEEWGQLVRDGLPGIDAAGLAWIDRMADGWPFYVQMAAAMVWQFGDLEMAEREFRFQAEDRFRELWRDLGAEQTVLRALAQMGKPIDVKKGLGDRLCRYGVVRQDGRLFSEAFGDWIREDGGAV